MQKGLTANGGQKRMTAMGSTVEKASDVRGTTRRLLSYWGEYKPMLSLIVFLSLLGVGCSLLGPYILGLAIDQCVTETVASGVLDISKIVKLLLFFFGVHLFSAFCVWFQEYGMMYTTQKIVKKMREEMILKLQSLSIRYYDNHLRGTLMSYFTNDIELIKEAMGNSLIQLITSVLTLIGSIVLMAKLSLQLMIVTCLTVPLTILLSKFIMKRTRNYFSKQQVALGNLNGMVEESISGMKVIQTFGQEKQQLEKFKVLNQEVKETGVRAQIYSGILMPLMRVLDNCSYIFVTLVGALLAYRGSITIGVIQSFLLYTKNFQRPINAIATQLNSIQSAIAGAERIFALLDEQPEVTDKQETIHLSDVKGKIEFDNIHFGYTENHPVLKGITFNAMPDEVVAIVGTTGAGKTTIINLLTRFYDLQEGHIRIDGVDIRDMTQKELRENIGIVLQDPYLFSESIQYNIGYGKNGYTESEVVEAAHAANCESFIRQLPLQYDQPIMEQGGGISHGQKQLLTIARAILSNAPILVLDEATSNIDTRTEILIQQAIQRLSVGKTCIVIAHRLSTIKNADKIIVIDDGKIVECGKHQELLDKQGAYHQIYHSQFSS